MIPKRLYPDAITLRQTQMYQLMRYAVQQGQTGMVSELLELNEVCTNLEFLLIDYSERLLQLEEALDLLLTSLENARGRRLTEEALQLLIDPIRSRINPAHGRLETLN
jgi:hypothetical protein